MRAVAVLILLAATLIVAPAAEAVSTVQVTNNAPTAAAGARTQYAASFTTSVTQSAPDSRINVTFPNGTGGLDGLSAMDVMVGSTRVGGCFSPTAGALSVQCFLNPNVTIPAATVVRLLFNGVVNPATPADTYRVNVSATADPPADSAPYGVVANHPVTG